MCVCCAWIRAPLNPLIPVSLEINQYLQIGIGVVYYVREREARRNPPSGTTMGGIGRKVVTKWDTTALLWHSRELKGLQGGRYTRESDIAVSVIWE